MNGVEHGARPEFSQDMISAAIEFFHTNSPNRMTLFDTLPSDSPPRRRIANNMTRRYRSIENFKESNPELFDLLVSQVKLRDDAFQLAKQGNSAALRDKASQIVDVSLKTRKIRLDLLEKELATQQTQLANDESAQSKQVQVDDEMTREKDDVDQLSRAARWFQNARERTGRSDDITDPRADPLAEAAPIAIDTDQK